MQNLKLGREFLLKWEMNGKQLYISEVVEKFWEGNFLQLLSEENLLES